MKDQEQNVKSWEAGRIRLIEDQKLKRENEQTHRAALYVTLRVETALLILCRSLPGLLEGTAMLRVRSYFCKQRETAELS